MKSQFKRTIHQFLEEERISLESGIVNEITYRLAGVAFNEKNCSTGFSFDDRWVSDENKEKITFSIPSGFSLVQLHQILSLFKIAPEEYRVDSSLTLDSQFVLEQFVPQFKQYFLNIKASEPTTISKYKIASAPILESTAKETLKKYISDANDILLSENLKELTDSWKSLVKFMILLSGQMRFIEKFPLFYKDILKSNERINTFLTMPEISENKTLVAKLNMIREGIELYARYHRNESVLALIAFEKELKAFLKDYKVSTEIEECDILEHVVLGLAGAKQNSLSSCRFSIGSDPSRFTLTYSDIDKENTQKIINYMVALGDETACEGYGGRHHGSYLAQAECALERIEKQSFHVKRKITESHTVEVDGKFFYETVLPKIKEQIAKMAAENLLTEYQELSKELFPVESPKLRVSPLSIFQEQKSEPTVCLDENDQMAVDGSIFLFEL